MPTFNIVSFHNFSDKNFTFEYGRDSETIKAGETRQLVDSVAEHGAKHLIDRELIRASKVKQLNNEEARSEMWKKIFNTPTEVKEVKVEEKQESTPEVEEKFPGLKSEVTEVKEEVKGEEKPVDLSRAELFAKVKELGIKVKVPVTNEELRRLVSVKTL